MLKEIAETLQELENNALEGFSSRSALLSAKALFHHLGAEYDQMRRAYEELLELWAAHPKIVLAFPDQHARIQTAWLNSLVASGQTGKHLGAVRALRRIPLKASKARARLVFQSYNIELLFLMEKTELSKAGKFLEEFKDRLEELAPLLDPIGLMSFYFNAAIVNFDLNAFRRAFDWAGKILKGKASQQSNMLMLNASLLQCICSIEMGNLDLAEVHIRATLRLQKQGKVEWPFGTAVLNGLQMALAAKDMRSENEAYRTARENLIALEQSPAPILQGIILKWLDNNLRTSV
jgi:hypothetical protein